MSKILTNVLGMRVAVYRFNGFELDQALRRLTKNDVPLRIGARAFDLLAFLVENAGRVVSKTELMKAAWPTTVVDDVSLRVHMVAVRKILHDGVSSLCIENIAGRGYQFVKPVTRSDSAPTAKRREPASSLRGTQGKLVGREAFLSDSVELMKRSRVMTIVGPGGIGKTSAAMEIAQALSDAQDEVTFLDLATLADGSLLKSYLASKLGLSVYSDDPLPGIIHTLGESGGLLVFDNCEHIVDACAAVVQDLTDSCPNISILATSREPLRVASERVRQLSALEVPLEGELPATSGQFSAIELFAERIALVSDDYAFTDVGELEIAAGIVRRLDGIPLAIELAAARVADLGLATLAKSLDDPIRVLRRGRRTAPPRQQTLRATLDWSYQWLSGNEKTLLTQLSTFAGRFSEEAASEIASHVLSDADLLEALDGLASKSLLSVSRGDRFFRLLETTREYASTKLAESDHSHDYRLAHARYVRDRLQKAQLDWQSMQTAEWMASYGELISDIRFALAFCFDADESASGLEISVTSGIVWTQLGLMSEQLKVVERAIKYHEEGHPVPLPIESQLRSTYAGILFHLRGGAADDLAVSEFQKAGAIAERIGDQTLVLRAHSGVTAVLTIQGKFHEATDIALNLEQMFGVVPNGASSRIICHNAHYLGNHALTRRMAGLALEGAAKTIRTSSTSGASYDQKTTALLLLAKTAWIEGQAAQAEAYLEEAVTEALLLDQSTSTCMLLATSPCPVYFGMGKHEAGLNHLALLHDISTKHSLSRWQEWARGYDLVSRPDLTVDTTALENHLASSTVGPRLENLCVLAGVDAGNKLIDYALSGHAGWCRAELYRIKGEIAFAAREGGARDWMARGLELAVEQGAVLWELRSAMSIAMHDVAQRGVYEKTAVEIALNKFSEPLPGREQAMLDRLHSL